MNVRVPSFFGVFLLTLIGALAGFGTAEQQAKGKERTDAADAAALMRIPDGRAKQDGIGAGQAAAMAMLAQYLQSYRP